MSHSVVIAAPDQTTGYELRARVDELEDFEVVDVADSTTHLLDLVAQRDPEIVIVHEQLGPVPVLQTVRDVVARRPGTALVLLTEEFSPDVVSAAMDAGVRAVLEQPVTHEDLQGRLQAAAEWVASMRRHLSSEAIDSSLSSRGRLVAVAGSKGGVGCTTIAVHLAHHAVSTVAGRSVCLVDLDLDNGDISDFLGITHRLDVSDLAKVADDLSPQTIGSSVHRGTSGLGTVVAPARIEDVGVVGERETVLILAALRRQFDLVVVDCGSTITPASASAVETADDVLLVTTPDLLALRGAHRLGERWNRVGARNIEKVKTVINKVTRDSDIQPDTAARLLPSAPIEVSLPDASKVLQRGLNHQDPSEITAEAWWVRVGELATEVGTVPEAIQEQRREPRWTLFRQRHGEPASAEQGQASLEFLGVLPIVFLLVGIIWQLGLWGVTATYTSHAADEAARSAGIGGTTAEVRDDALRSVPTWFRDGMDVSQTIGGTVKVTSSMPIIAPVFTVDGLDLTSETPIVTEAD